MLKYLVGREVGENMEMLKKLEVGEAILYSDCCFSGEYNQQLFIKKALSNENENDKYYINVYSTIDGRVVRQGYIYFYLDHRMKSSDFIGINISKEYRGLNIASLLISAWIDLCFNNGYDFMGVNKKQRKPFLLYLLKTYGFEILDKSLYISRDDVITICRSKDIEDRSKILFFKDMKHENSFKGTNVYRADNYQIVHDKRSVLTLDDVIMPLQNMNKDSVDYYLFGLEKANEKVLKTMNAHRR